MNNIPLGTPGGGGDRITATGSLRERVGFAIEWFASLAGSWLHGTMMSRMTYINAISKDRGLTAGFDRRMTCVRAALVLMFICCCAWAGVVSLHADAAPDQSPRGVRGEQNEAHEFPTGAVCSCVGSAGAPGT